MRAASLSGQRVAVRGADGVDGGAELAALGRLDVQVPGDLDELAVHGDDPGARGDLAGGQGEQLALPQPGVGRDMGHQLIQLAAPARRPAPGRAWRHRSAAGISAGSTHSADSPEMLACGSGTGRSAGLPVHLPKPRIGQVPALDARAHHGRQAAVQPVALAGGRRGVDDLLHVTGGDVLAGDRRDDRGGEPLAQPPLGVGVPPRPPLGDRQPVGVQVVRDQVRAGPLHVRRPGPQPLGDLGQLGGQLRLGHRLPEPPPPVLGERRPPRLPRLLRRVHQNPALRLHHHTSGIAGGLASVPGHAGRAACRRGTPSPRAAARRGAGSRPVVLISVLILDSESADSAMGILSSCCLRR